jgi:YD repeat-containing protein
MKPRPFFAALLAFAAVSTLPGQEDAAPDSGLFPLSLLLDAAVFGEPPWSPDWPLAMPPDGFALASGRAAALTLVLPAAYLDAAPGGSGDAAAGTAEDDGGGEAPVEYRLVRDEAGRFVEFPFFAGGALYQAAAEYEGAGAAAIRKITLDTPAAPDPWEFEFLEYRQGAPALARINRGGAWYFAAPEYLETRTNETWYDAEGLAQGFFALEYRLQDGARRLLSTDRRSDQEELILTYDYNSAGRVSGISAPEGEYAALYNAAARPRYWERPGAAYTLQWDEQGFLVRITGTSQDETAGEPQKIDIRYEYTLDERGNWIERRETSLALRFGRLVPDSEGTIYRIIEYADEYHDEKR